MSSPTPQLQLVTLKDCRLAIGRYPAFSYDARQGGGRAHISPAAPGKQQLAFDVATLQIPDLQGQRAKLLGLALPPGLRIRIQPRRLEGLFDPATGAMVLRFAAAFQLVIGPWWRARDLHIETELTTEAVQGRRHAAQGSRLQGDGLAVLVGLATVWPSGTAWLDRFLGLPDEALAVLRCRFSAT